MPEIPFKRDEFVKSSSSPNYVGRHFLVRITEGPEKSFTNSCFENTAKITVELNSFSWPWYMFGNQRDDVKSLSGKINCTDTSCYFKCSKRHLREDPGSLYLAKNISTSRYPTEKRLILPIRKSIRGSLLNNITQADFPIPSEREMKK